MTCPVYSALLWLDLVDQTKGHLQYGIFLEWSQGDDLRESSDDDPSNWAMQNLIHFYLVLLTIN